MKYTKACKYCEKDFGTDRDYTLYCSTLCRGRWHQRNNGKGAQTLQCLECGTDFKRKSAQSVRCESCRDIYKNSNPNKITEKDIPVLERQRELQMQKEWLKKNKVTVL